MLQLSIVSYLVSLLKLKIEFAVISIGASKHDPPPPPVPPPPVEQLASVLGKI
jgi:hypothetical protein